MRKLAAAQPAEFQVWVFTRADLARFIIIDIVFSSALYAGLRRVNGHDTIAILGSSVGTHLCKYLQNRGFLPKLRPGKPVRQLPWRLTPD